MSEITHRMDGFTSRSQLRGDVLHIALEGDLDFRAARLAEPAFTELISVGPCTVVLDLGELSFIDSAGLAVLIRAKRRIEARSASMFIDRHSNASKRLVELAALTKWFTPTDGFGTELVPCPVCDNEISPLVPCCEHCGSAL